ncbi:MAG: ABC transporter permease subunit [Actinobacteria bacterium]|nr:ABC transporter permease subunit [Actinomycetota bacterium]MSY54168.1 ABC transporter permease subunit [Actinomycetota bacterium]MSZ68592.1 ABC transporter permease subunit [Actinomycetota bacterium]
MKDAALIEPAKIEGDEVALRTPKQIALARFKRNKVGPYSLYVSLFFILAAFFAPVITHLWGLSSTDIYTDGLDEFALPTGGFGGISWQHPFGLEPGAGRDVFSMLLYGSRISFTVALVTSVASIGIGMIVGIAGGFFRGRIDALIGRYSDFLFAFPSFFMIIALSYPMVDRVEKTGIARGNNARLLVLIIFFVFFGWPGFARLIRAQSMSLRERDFIMAAQAQGASNWRIITKEMLPNLWPTAIVFLSLSLPGYLSAEAVFSFLGVGIQPPASTFGLVLSDAVKYWKVDPSYLFIPSAMLIIIVLALNLLGDAVRDALDTKSE